MTEPEFTRPLPLVRIGGTPRVHAIAASQDECDAVARRLDVSGISDLHASFTVEALEEGYRVSGPVEARAVVPCALTLVPLTQSVQTDFAVTYQPAGVADMAAEVEIGANDCDVEPLVGTVIDLGECAVQALALAIDYTPRAPGAEAAAAAAGIIDEVTDRRLASPFAALNKLK